MHDWRSSLIPPDEAAQTAEREYMMDDLAVARAHAEAMKRDDSAEAEPAPEPVNEQERTKNPLRPSTFEEIIGQEKATEMMKRVVSAAQRRGSPLDHVLLVGASGTGKSTFSNVIANEMGVLCYEVQAPVSHDTLLALRETMEDRDILRIEEIHQQAIMERRGRGAATEPEVIYNVLEDRTILAGNTILPYPEITVIGTTTDEGMLPEPFLNRFPLRPRLESYSEDDIAIMAIWNADKLGMTIDVDAAGTLAAAARGTPRQVNNYIKNAQSLSEDGHIDVDLAEEVLFNLNGVTEDGLTSDMQAMLKYLYQRGRREKADGSVVYEAGVNSIATGIGKSRDSKAIALRVEPYLIEQGLVQVGGRGRNLTEDGVARAAMLTQGGA